MTFAVEQNEALDPIQITLLGANAVMLEPNRMPHLIEKFRIASARRACQSGGHEFGLPGTV